MLYKMVMDPKNNGKVAAVHHSIAQKMLRYAVLSGDCRTASKWPQVPPPIP